MTIDGETLVLTITSDDRALHVGPAENTAIHLAVMNSGSGVWEYFAPDGQPLMITKCKAGFVLAEDPDQPPVDHQLLLDRIDAALAHMQVALDRQLASSRRRPPGPPPGNGPQAGSGRTTPGLVAFDDRVPRPVGSLQAVLESLAVAFDFLVPTPHSGNWLHELAHLAGTAH